MRPAADDDFEGVKSICQKSLKWILVFNKLQASTQQISLANICDKDSRSFQF